MMTVLKCLLVLGLAFLLMAALPGVGMAVGSVEVGLLVLAALVVVVVIVRGDLRGRGR